MTAAAESTAAKPNLVGRVRSRQAGHPSGLLGRIVGRLMVKETAMSNDRAVDLLKLDSPATVLDIGFGQGRTTEKLIDQGHQVLGIEVSETMLRQATARNRKACNDGRAELLLGNGVTIPFADDAADAAVTAHTVYFMADPQATLIDIARVLRPGGRLSIACRVSDDGIPSWMDPEIYRIPSISTIECWLGNAGFTTVAHHQADESAHHTHRFTGDLP